MASQHSELPSTNNGQGHAALEQPIAPPVPPPIPPWYFFNPLTEESSRHFYFPRYEMRICLQIAVQDVFGETPQDLAQKYRKTAQWKRNSKPLKVISSGTAVIGTKIGLSYAGNRSTITKWHLDEYTAEGEDSQLAEYKLYMGQQPAHNLLLEAAQDPNPTVTYNGYLLPNDVISVNARKRFDASLTLNWDDDDQGLEPPRTHFPTWRNLLQNFSCCNEVELDIHHDAVARALTFPENFRKTFSPPLLHIQRLKVFIVRLRCPQTMAGISAFTDSLRWMAPHALISLAYWDYGEFDSDYGEFDSSGEDE